MQLSNPPDRTPAQYPAAKILTGSLTRTHVVICTVVESQGSLLCGMRFFAEAFIPTRTQASERVRVSVCKCGLSINKNHYCHPKAADTGRRAPLSSNLPLSTAARSSFTLVLPSALSILSLSLLFHCSLCFLTAFHSLSLCFIHSHCLCLPARFSSSGSFSDLHN